MIISIRPITPELAEAVIRWAQLPACSEFFRNWPPLQDWNRPDLAAVKIEWGYGVYEDERLIGVIQLYFANRAAQTVEMGMCLGEKTEGDRSEILCEITRLMKQYLFEDQGFQKVSMRILTHRDQLQERLCELGFRVEGTLKRSCKLNGQLQDERLLSIFKE